MKRIDENLSVGAYFRQSIGTVDGIAWIIVCITSIISILDLLLGINAIPLRESHNPSKAIILLFFSPLLVFLTLVWLRQLPFGSYPIVMWIRACLCVAVFLIINF